MQANDIAQCMKLLSHMRQTQIPHETQTSQTQYHTTAERIIQAAIPFLDIQYQKLFRVLIHGLQMQRVWSEPMLQTRNKQESYEVRQQQMLSAIRAQVEPHIQSQIDAVQKFLNITEFMKEDAHGFLESNTNHTRTTENRTDTRGSATEPKQERSGKSGSFTFL